MTRKAPAKKAPKTAARPKPRGPQTVYIVVRTMVSVNESFTEPDRVFATKAAARKHADRLNRELRACTNPFAGDSYPENVMSGGTKTFTALLKRLGVAVPEVRKGERNINWEAWWDGSYFDTTDAQRDAMWDALDRFKWYEVKPTTLEE